MTTDGLNIINVLDMSECENNDNQVSGIQCTPGIYIIYPGYIYALYRSKYEFRPNPRSHS